jgi:hypothetical protein
MLLLPLQETLWKTRLRRNSSSSSSSSKLMHPSQLKQGQAKPAGGPVTWQLSLKEHQNFRSC